MTETEIALHSDFAPLVIDGRKTSTVRYGMRDYPLGRAHIVVTFSDTTLPISITALVYTAFGALNDEDARRDGFNNIHELRDALLRFYPYAADDDVVTIVRFAYTGQCTCQPNQQNSRQ